MSVPARLASYLDRREIGDSRVTALTADASDRRYYRVQPPGETAFVVALHASPFAPGTLPFVNVARLFAAMPLPVPRVRDEAADLGILALDDLGDLTLQAHVASAPTTTDQPRYERAVDFVAVMQQRGAALADARFIPYGLAFDVEKLMWEMDFFLRHFLQAFRRVELTAASLAALRAHLLALVEELAAEPRVLCHRDYHSRNLMVDGDNLWIIDFQDARMGPDTYDLASLLRDSYVDMPAAMFDALLARFVRAAGITSGPAAFRERFDRMALQRNLKALGTFGHQAVARANPAYAQYVPRTLAYVRENLSTHPRFGNLHDVLAESVPELA